nr:hypothetical protein BaRGS_024935 [Batillaria attramentaria]
MFKPNFLIRDIVEVHARRRQGAEQGGMCPRHPGKELELYCRDCRASVCDRCVALHHRKCEDVVELAEQAQETQQITQQQQQCVTQLLRQLEAKKRRCAAGKKELERIERDIDAKIEYEGQEILRKVADFLCTRKEALKRQAHGHCRKCVNVVNAYTEKCDELSGTLRSLDKMLCNKLRPERLHPSFVNAQEESQVQGMLQKLETAVHKLDSPCHFTVRLIMDDSVITTILANLKLGEISTEEAGDPIRPASDATQRLPPPIRISSAPHGAVSDGQLSEPDCSSGDDVAARNQPASRGSRLFMCPALTARGKEDNGRSQQKREKMHP